MLKKLVLASAATLSLTLGSTVCLEAQAQSITAKELEYEITTVTGTYEEVRELLPLQPWWSGFVGAGSETLAVEAATNTGPYGLPNEKLGPVFVYAEDSLDNWSLIHIAVYSEAEERVISVALRLTNPDLEWDWAIVEGAADQDSGLITP